nr:MAG TPA_asm: hypothetical protein [Caudoviricetes sp.]DAU30516.1 MAG TPA: hypothetical protein [Caudoviricetes sp.]
MISRASAELSGLFLCLFSFTNSHLLLKKNKVYGY